MSEKSILSYETVDLNEEEGSLVILDQTKLPEDVVSLYPNARRECGLQLLPGPDGDEGFFMARLRRQR